VREIHRRSHFVEFVLEAPPDSQGSPPTASGGVGLAVHLMLAGGFALREGGSRAAKPAASLAFEVELASGGALQVHDPQAMAKVWIFPAHDRSQVTGLDARGVDVLDPRAFTFDAFCALARARRIQAKSLLLDKDTFDALGNAYADEALFAAQIHPKSWVSDLDDEALRRLWVAIPAVLSAGVAEVARRAPDLRDKVRDFLAVRGKKGQACPRCGDTIRTCGVNGYDAFFCPTCQADVRESSPVRWRPKP
jgi:formamidopyrimidine-DNA glycosylase